MLAAVDDKVLVHTLAGMLATEKVEKLLGDVKAEAVVDTLVEPKSRYLATPWQNEG